MFQIVVNMKYLNDLHIKFVIHTERLSHTVINLSKLLRYQYVYLIRDLFLLTNVIIIVRRMMDHSSLK